MTNGKNSQDPYTETPVPRGPLAEKRAEDWEQYAAVVGRHSQKLIRDGGPDPAKWPKPKNTNGTLVVIGSGIKSVSQFTVEALGYLKDADQVFYHVADPVTENYVRKMKPNAKDLSVFYGNKKERILTYYQMVEAMLYPVRHGQKVVTIYYGHPGIFVFASHRAIRIAHKQGLKAKMLPGVSALDCLFADLGVDPSYPGLQVLEATDFLVRNRKILTDSHLVILQVGCVGDRGYRRKGYLMENFHILIERIQAIYGTDYKITHYIASQFPSVKPTIQIIPLKCLQDADFVKKNITAVSTFYVAPKDTRKTDPEMAKKLGLVSLVKPEIQEEAIQTQKSESKPAKLRDISKYGLREQNSLKTLSTWKVPGAYDSTVYTAAADFMVSLAQEPKKLSKFQKNPGKLLNEATGIMPWQARYLSSANRAMVRLAVKPNSNNAARAAAIELFTNNSFCKAYADEMKKYYHDPDLDTKLTSFLELHGFKTTPDAVENALQQLRESSLLPWRQVYHTSTGILEIRCKNANDKGQVIWKDAPVQNFTFTKSTLNWNADGVNQSSAVLMFATEDGLPLFTGKLWDKNHSQPPSQNINGTIENFKSPLSVWRGNYGTRTLAKGSKRQGIPGPEIAITFSSSNPVGSVECGGKPIADFKFENKTLSWAHGEIVFFASKATASDPSVEKFYGYIWNEGKSKPAAYNFWGTKDTTFLKPWSGKYETFIGPEGKAKSGQELIINGGVNIASSNVHYGGRNIKNFQFNNPVLSWQDDGKNVEIRFEVFTNKKLGFSGKMSSTNESKPANNNFEGLFDSIYLDAWLGSYYTKSGAGPGKTTDGQPFSIVKQGNDYLVTYNGSLIKSYHYYGAKRSLQWSTDGNNSNGILQFYIPPPEKGTGLRFFGKVWAEGQSIPDATNYWGSTVPFPGYGSSGNIERLLEQVVENLVTIAVIELLKYAWKKFKKWLKSKRDGSSKEEQEKLKKESEEADKKAENQEEKVNDQDAKTEELDPEPDPSPEPPSPPDPAPEPPSNAVETDTDTTDTDTTETDTDTDVDTDVDVDTDIDIVVDICSLM